MEQNADIRKLIERAQRRTSLMPELAVTHSLELDRQLREKGLRQPVTYSATDCFNGHQLASEITHPKDATTPLITLWRAEQLRRSGQPRQAAALAFESAQGPEVPALNLMYANLCLANESLWLTFLNKYLDHRAALDKRSPNDYSMTLSPSNGSRFSRLTLARTPSISHHDKPLVTVLMPVYNAERTLEMAANSILNQTWRAIELILIDDASTDGSLAIAYQLKQKDPRVRVLELSQNGGPYIARNTGAQHAVGAYITVHDADDWALPTRLADQITELRNSPDASVGMSHMIRIQDDGLIRRMQPTGWITPDGGLRLCFPSMLFDQKYFHQKLGAWDSVKAGADLEMFQRIRRFDPKALVISMTLSMLQLDHPASLTSSAALYNDERGISEWRINYQHTWTANHQRCSTLPFVSFNHDQQT